MAALSVQDLTLPGSAEVAARVAAAREFQVERLRALDAAPLLNAELEPILRASGIVHLVLSGVSTGGGVASGVRDGHDRDYRVTVLEDCCRALTDDEHPSVIENHRRFATIAESGAFVFRSS